MVATSSAAFVDKNTLISSLTDRSNWCSFGNQDKACLVTPCCYLQLVRCFSQRRPLHLLVCVCSTFFLHLKHGLFFCFLLFYLNSAGFLFVVILASYLFVLCRFSFSLLAPRHCHSSVSFSYFLSLMIHTTGQSIMVSAINPSLSLPPRLPLSFSVTAWLCEICSHSGKSTFILRKKYALWEHKKLYVPLQGEIFHGHTAYTNTYWDASWKWESDGAMN